MKDIKQLRGAEYNPRVITDKELETLTKSYKTFGDLSGVVFNIKTKRLVSGHQRIKTLKLAKAKTRIVKTKAKDQLGTVAEGYIEAVYPDKTSVKIPYREVSWSNVKSEKAANIAANAAGGNFDVKKLSKLVAELETDTTFDIELTGLKPSQLKNLQTILPNHAPSDAKRKKSEGFQSIDVDSVEFQHKCPRCDYEFN